MKIPEKTINCGSEWNLWDLHIHAPTSAKENNFFVCLNGKKKYGNKEEVWGKYIDAIEHLPSEVKVLGITDYYSIDGYVKTKEYKDKGRLKNIDLLIPNLELRLSDITNNNQAVNVHILFSPQNTIEKIRNSLHQLKDTRGNTVAEMKEEYIKNSMPLISFEKFKEYAKEQSCKIDFLTAVSGKEDGLSGLKGAKETIADDIRSNIDFIFSSNDSDREFNLGNKEGWNPEDYIKKYGVLKPCIHGSDAHCLEKICNPDFKRYCWIKAKLTFDGLRQLLCNPEDRVHIGEVKPALPSDTNVISKIVDGDKELHLNSNMNVIIGSRSSGKSFLLSRIAEKSERGVIKKQFEKMSVDGVAKADSLNTKIMDNPINVFWGDSENTDGSRKILYIPQNFLNHLNEDSDEIQNIITRYIESSDALKDEYAQIITKYEQSVNNITNDICVTVDKYSENNLKIFTDKEKLKECAGNDVLDAKITTLDAEMVAIRKGSTLTEEDVVQYKELSVLRDKLLNEIKILSDNKTILERDFLVIDNSDGLNKISAYFEPKLSEPNNNKLKLEIEGFKGKLKEVLTAEIRILTQKIKNKNNELTEVSSKINAYSSKLENSKVLEAKLKEHTEYAKKQTIRILLESDLEELLRSEKELRNCIRKQFDEYKIEIDNSVVTLNTLLEKVGEDLRISTRCIIDTPLFRYNESYFKPSRQEGKYVDNIIVLDNIDLLLNKDNTDIVGRHSGIEIYKTVKKLLVNPYKIQFEVIEDGQELTSEMSVGQRSITMLKLLVEFSDEKYPILLDQPEDDLDNEAIYTRMVKFIKKKKKERQFIVVTHNANVVLGADVENVIVCSRVVAKYSIENDAIEEKNIRENICRLLEGGKEAFNKRERQYVGM